MTRLHLRAAWLSDEEEVDIEVDFHNVVDPGDGCKSPFEASTLDRCGRPHEIASVVAFLASEEGRFISDQGRAWYRGLKLQGVETEMIVYPREGHGLTERAHQLDLMRRVLAWYDRHLKN